jgi:hypothetical protein
VSATARLSPPDVRAIEAEDLNHATESDSKKRWMPRYRAQESRQFWAGPLGPGWVGP